jgi:5'-3' exonuclease
MGIPSYFSHLIKEHSNIIRKQKDDDIIDNLYIDSNSIIYDVIYSIEEYSFENIFKNICMKLESYIYIIKPRKTVIIAFDGVAPLAKMVQQRLRRNKGIILDGLNNMIDINSKKKWDTTQITPGTEFMEKMTIYLEKYFKKDFNCDIIISSSNERGEGEQKIFKYMRDNKDKHADETTVIYGLDADLIMLSLNHASMYGDILLYRETPEFIKSINSDLDPNQLYILNINELKYNIAVDMNNGINDITYDEMDILINDYVFICFILGNDFIPHSPCINIRTNGIDILLDIYKSNFSHKNSIIKDNEIVWSEFSKFIKIISTTERDYLIEEHKRRDRFENRYYPNSSVEEKKYKLNLFPTIFREDERYINPYLDGWESRYYSVLFKIKYDKDRIKKICNNYLEALEWNYKYYTDDCINWKWEYKYHYTPLFSDLIKYIPFYNTTFVKEDKNNEVSPLVQLCYVLPKECHYLIPDKKRIILDTVLDNIYSQKKILIWHYCKNIWESHLDLPRIDITNLELLLK